MALNEGPCDMKVPLCTVCTLYFVLCTVWTVYCVCSVWTVCCVYCMYCTVCIVCTVVCVLFVLYVLCVLCALCTLCTVSTVFTVCTVCTSLPLLLFYTCRRCLLRSSWLSRAVITGFHPVLTSSWWSPLPPCDFSGSQGKIKSDIYSLKRLGGFDVLFGLPSGSAVGVSAAGGVRCFAAPLFGLA